MATKDFQKKLVGHMKRWQRIEDASVASAVEIMARSDNPVVRMVMEIIQMDSQAHRRAQQMIIESLEKRALALTPEDLETVWTMIAKHIRLEKESEAIMKEALAQLKDKPMVVQHYLLQYLMEDEKKHDALLANLESIKRGMYPYG